MKFKFSLEALLKQNKILEDLAKKEYYEAEFKTKESLNKVEAMFLEITQNKKKISEIEMAGGNISASTVGINSYIQGLKIKIAREQEVFRELKYISDQKLEVLREKAIEHKKVDTLKAKRFAEFKIAKRKKDMKAMDELSIIKYKRAK